MFDITPIKTFKDSVHGYINIPVCFVNNIIDTDLFQRLRNIDQTGMRVLYPNAKHDRFGHSLGVFHLGSKAVEALLDNFSSNTYWKISSDSNRALFWAKNKLLFLIACLLHDIGHAPFSHSLENIIFENRKEEEISYNQILIERINSTETMGEKVEDLGKAAAHEKMGALIIFDFFRENIEQIYKYLNERNFPQEDSQHILYAEHYQDNIVIDSSQLDNDICFIVRMILGLKYQGYEPEKQIRNCFIELLNGDNFDVDKLDYIVRDTKMSGISNIDIDIDRLLGSVCIITRTIFIDKVFKNEHFNNRTIHKLNNLKKSNKQKGKNKFLNNVHFSGKFRGTLILDLGSEVTIAKGSRIVSFKGSREDTPIKYFTGGDSIKFSSESIVYQDGTLLLCQKNKVVPLSDTKNSVPFTIKIQDAELVSENEFKFYVCGEGSMELQINGFCDIRIKGSCKTETEIDFYEDTLVDGTINEIEFMGNEIEDVLPTAKAYNTFSIGFNKQALSIITNVIEARNYLYLWIYAHHKVTYYANFLIPVISNNLLSITDNEKFPCWRLTYEDIVYLDDGYVWTVIKHFNHINYSQSDQLKKLCEELLSRNYKRSLFKSLAEYDLLFEAFTDDEKRKVKNKLEEAVDKKYLCVMEDSRVIAGFIRQDVLETLKQQEGMHRVNNIVYVAASYKRKQFNTHETFIVLHNEAISLDKILLLADKKNLADSEKFPYFYLYYDSSSETLKEKIEEKEAIKMAILNYVSEVK